jgi:GDP-4-dehydro-6-deoxy-D-mannose reductase
MSKHRLLVTGLHGFVGRMLADRVRKRPDAAEITLAGLNKINGEPVDIRDAAAVAKVVANVQPSAVIHLAAIASPREAASAPAEAWAVNLMGTFNLADAVLKHAAEARFIFAGSSEAYGAVFAELASPVSENTGFQPISPYGATKAAADIMLAQMARDGLAATRFRPFNHSGPGQAPIYVVSSFARQIVRIERGWQEPVLRVGNLEARRDFLHVRDVVDAYLLAALGDASAMIDAFNLATGEPVAIAAILQSLVEQSSAAIEVRQDPALHRVNELPVVSGDASKARQVLGWAPLIPLSQTLFDVLDHWRAIADATPKAMQ